MKIERAEEYLEQCFCFSVHVRESHSDTGERERERGFKSKM